MSGDENIKFVDENFEVESLTAINQTAPNPENSAPSIDFGNLPPLDGMESIGNQEPDTGEEVEAGVIPPDVSEEDTLFLVETAWNSIPQIVWPSLPARDPKQIASFNRAFVRYCIKKGIDPMDYLFDEFGLIVCGLGIANSIRVDLKVIKEDKEKKEDTTLNLDHSHAKEVAKSTEDSYGITKKEET